MSFDEKMTAGTTGALRPLNDSLLWPLLEASDERAREAALATLVDELHDDVIVAVLRRVRCTDLDLSADDLEEIGAMASLKLVRKLRATAASADHAIQDVRGYVATLVYNAVHDLRRRRYPERHRLKRNLRYVLTREAAFALWESHDTTVAGLAAWKGKPAMTPAVELTRFSATAVMRDSRHPVEALRAILTTVGHPLVFEALVDVVAAIWEIRDVVHDADAFPSDQRQDPLSSIEQRQYLERLWSEIASLPANQRAALLLNLRDANGGNALPLFLLLNITSVAELARATGMSEETLSELWPRLPLDDFSIAEILTLSRQQVINLRKSARLRLGRRMEK